MERIENVEKPIIGKIYLVKCVRSKRPFVIGKHYQWCPVFGEKHHDKELYLEKIHYHIDWRFMPQKYLEEHHQNYQNKGWYLGIQNTYFYSPMMEYEIEEERYLPLEYLQDFEHFPDHSFDELLELYKNVKMKDMICPHKKANLKSCKVENDIVTCPCHGLKWNVKTGYLSN